MTAVQKHIDHFTAALRAEADPAYAKKMKAYMKGHFEYFGVRGPKNKEIFNSYWKSNKEELTKDFRVIISKLWKQDRREYQYIAIHLFKKLKKHLTIDDLKWLEKLITSKSWWDTVDFLASHGVGQIFSLDDRLKYEKAEEYISSENLWKKRSALIFQLFYKEKTDQDLLFALIDSSLGTKEFFINKAAGWALRQYSKVNPQSVKDYIDLQRPNLSILTIKEGSKYI